MTTLPECVEVGDDNADHSIIWLHGLGADGNDFVPIVPELRLPESLQVRFVFPHAPVRPITINGGMPMRAWFDIRQLDLKGIDEPEGIAESQAIAENLIAREQQRGVAAGHIILAGFSQGGAIALQTGLRYADKLAGIMALSTWLPMRERLAAEQSDANRNTSIFMAHGSMDPMVPQALGEVSRDHLLANDYNVSWHSYPMQHQVCLEEINDIGRWIQQVFAD